MGTATANPPVGAAPPPPPPPPVEQAGGPLTPAQLAELADASRRARKVARVAAVASLSAWTTAVIAVLSAPFVFTGPTAIAMTVALAAVAWNEFRGRNLVRAFEPRGARVLGRNQLAFMGVLIAYALWCIYTGLAGPQPYEAEIERMPELAKTLGSVADLRRQITVAVYGGLIAGTLIFQGLTAIYYFRGARRIRTYLEQTPQWVVDLQRHVPAR